MIANLFFYLFATSTVLSSVLTITSRNPVHAVLWLIFTFFNSAGLFMLLGAEFLSMVLVIVYVGAVAVLFLFVIMMIKIDDNLKNIMLRHVPSAIFATGLLLANLAIAIYVSINSVTVISRSDFATPKVNEITNAHALGQILYTDFALQFQIAGLVLFIAMIGSIVLTHRHRPGVKKQDISNQLKRDMQDSMEIVDVKLKEGVDGIHY